MHFLEKYTWANDKHGNPPIDIGTEVIEGRPRPHWPRRISAAVAPLALLKIIRYPAHVCI